MTSSFPMSFAAGTWLFGRVLAVCYFIAFASLFVQLLGLYGSGGLLPMAQFTQRLREVGQDSFWQFPSLLWWKNSDQALKVFCFAGMLCSLAAFWGWLDGIWFLLCWFLYLSFASLGQDFLSFQWDSLLLEAGIVVLFLTPFKTDPRFFVISTPTSAGVILVWLLLFKLMFLSGVVKLASGDPTWRDLSAMSYHYWTQPIPNPLAWWANQLPLLLQKISTFLMFVIELVFPFLILSGRTRFIAFIGLAGLQVMIGLTGNYAFFNLLSLALCLPLLNNEWLSFLPVRIENTSLIGSLGIFRNVEGVSPMVFEGMALGLAVPLILTSLLWTVRPLIPAVVHAAPVQAWLSLVYPFRSNNPYGLFAVMTTDRPELRVEGSDDGQEWKPYLFRYKMEDPGRSLPFVAPHQPRLDWQMWFAAMDRFEESPWLQNLLVRLFEGRKEVLDLLAHNPFPGQPPRFLRVRRAQYTMTSLRDSGDGYWTVGPWDAYTPVFERKPQ